MDKKYHKSELDGAIALLELKYGPIYKLCELCGSVNLTRLEYFRHKIIHIKRHVCKTCGRTFFNNEMMKIHLSLHKSRK